MGRRNFFKSLMGVFTVLQGFLSVRAVTDPSHPLKSLELGLGGSSTPRYGLEPGLSLMEQYQRWTPGYDNREITMVDGQPSQSPILSQIRAIPSMSWEDFEKWADQHAVYTIRDRDKYGSPIPGSPLIRL